MLVAGIIPEKEPVLKIGIILPEDEKKILRIDHDRAINLSVYADKDLISFQYLEKIEVKAFAENSEINGHKCEEITILQDKSSYIELKDVPAGRGFHWNKVIDVKLSGKITIKSSGGNLVLINHLKLEDYLACVATSEMSAECPANFLEAQAIAARSWMLANVEQKHVHLGFDVCNDDCCQRFQGINNLSIQSKNAVNATRGLVLMYNGQIADARYSKSCGGMTEKFENLWENVPKAYLSNIFDGEGTKDIDLTREDDLRKWVLSVPESYCSPHYVDENKLQRYLGSVDEEANYFRWRLEITQEEITQNIREKCDIDITCVNALVPVNRAGSGRILKLQIQYTGSDGQRRMMVVEKDFNVRKILHEKFLFSSALAITAQYEHDNTIPVGFYYYGAGWGHGAGMCQIGALGMALKGFDAASMLKHYYPGTELVRIYK